MPESMPESIRDSPQTAVRLGAIHDLKLEQIAAERKWTTVQVLREALDDHHRRLFGRRSADMAPIRKRTPKG